MILMTLPLSWIPIDDLPRMKTGSLMGEGRVSKNREHQPIDRRVVSTRGELLLCFR